VFTAGKLAAVIALIVAGFALGGGATSFPSSGAAVAAEVAATPVHDVALAIAAGLFAFGGWHMVTYAAGETENAERTIPRAITLGVAIVTACYLALNAAYLYVLPLHVVGSSTRVAADAADALLGTGGAAVMSGLVVFSTFGALNGIILAGPRVYYSMAQDGLLFAWAGRVHPRHRTPHVAIALQAVWSCVLVATGTYRALFTRVIYTEWIFFALMAAGLLLLRRRATYQPRYRLWGYPLVPLVFIAASIGIVANQVAADPVDSALGLTLVALGWPVYHWSARRKAARGALAHADHRLP
jgi:APA family basic amino acid/polyamine antiporter